MSADLENYKIQLQQVEAALIAEPDNKELLELKQNVEEIIQLQQEILGEEEPHPAPVDLPTSSSKPAKDIQWKVGDRCLAPSKNGQRYVAVIDGISQSNVAVTFASNGVKHMVRLSDLKVAPMEARKDYVFQSKGKNSGPSKEWHAEKERRKLRAQKKEQRRKELDAAGEQQKNKWLNFNTKATTKHFKGIKKVEQSRSAPDGPRGTTTTSAGSSKVVSSRSVNKFGATSRGNMDALF